MTTMTAPRETKNLDIYGSPPLEWNRVIEALDQTRDLPVADSASQGGATIIRDEGELERIARLYSDWGSQVRDGAFWHEYSAPSAGPPPWDVWEITPTTIYAVATAEPHGATRWKL
jgi:hypothetical protein